MNINPCSRTILEICVSSFTGMAQSADLQSIARNSFLTHWCRLCCLATNDPVLHWRCAMEYHRSILPVHWRPFFSGAGCPPIKMWHPKMNYPSFMRSPWIWQVVLRSRSAWYLRYSDRVDVNDFFPKDPAIEAKFRRKIGTPCFAASVRI